jgi:hypothetical protein
MVHGVLQRLGRGSLPRTVPVSGRVLALGILIALVLLAWTAEPARALEFRDVPTGYRYRVAIEVMNELGVVQGFGDGTFRPNDPVNRQQFAKMVVLAMRIPVSEADISPFVDVDVSGPGSLFPDNYVAAAYREGITTGTSASLKLFSPWSRISLAQMVTMSTRASGRPLVVPPTGYESTWGDFNHVHGPTARLAQYNGLLREMAFPPKDPWRAATRGEAAGLLFNLMGTDPLSLNGRFLGTSGDLVRYFRLSGRTSEKFSVPLHDLAAEYIGYGRRFGIRADMAWAQMVHETNFGEYTGDVKPGQNNMAGIGATGGGVPGNSFATASLGVVAHLVHIAWYVYPTHLDDPYCVMSLDPNVPGDPRHFVIEGKEHRGNVRTVLGLGGKWAPSPEYGNAVLRHQQGIPVTVGW